MFSCVAESRAMYILITAPRLSAEQSTTLSACANQKRGNREPLQHSTCMLNSFRQYTYITDNYDTTGVPPLRDVLSWMAKLDTSLQDAGISTRLAMLSSRVSRADLRRRCSPRVVVPKDTSVDLCFTAFGVGPLVFVRGSINTQAYCNILDNEMLPTLWRFYGMNPCYFQDDNARCHVSRATMQWYADNNVRRLDWPAQTLDHNSIVHLWDELYRRVRARQARPKSIAQLMEWLQEERRRIPVDVLQTLVESMPDRVAAVIAARGTPVNTPSLYLAPLIASAPRQRSVNPWCGFESRARNSVLRSLHFRSCRSVKGYVGPKVFSTINTDCHTWPRNATPVPTIPVKEAICKFTKLNNHISETESDIRTFETKFNELLADSAYSGATVAGRLACSPPTKAIRVQSPVGPLRIFAHGNRARVFEISSLTHFAYSGSQSEIITTHTHGGTRSVFGNASMFSRKKIKLELGDQIWMYRKLVDPIAPPVQELHTRGAELQQLTCQVVASVQGSDRRPGEDPVMIWVEGPEWETGLRHLLSRMVKVYTVLSRMIMLLLKSGGKIKTGLKENFGRALKSAHFAFLRKRPEYFCELVRMKVYGSLTLSAARCVDFRVHVTTTAAHLERCQNEPAYGCRSINSIALWSWCCETLFRPAPRTQYFNTMGCREGWFVERWSVVTYLVEFSVYMLAGVTRQGGGGTRGCAGASQRTGSTNTNTRECQPRRLEHAHNKHARTHTHTHTYAGGSSRVMISRATHTRPSLQPHSRACLSLSSRRSFLRCSQGERRLLRCV
ncbi:hypothetical protein PR048_023971 [Dryococelus australis]|uniref:Uncharacterized protein n=1 Tax=Dryococelus australis TaxID=614101 RepID=A0ABQ9GVL8_9NEOP|nr:hypothetical protein PR048_023971 [Dryococelus australis]